MKKRTIFLGFALIAVLAILFLLIFLRDQDAGGLSGSWEVEWGLEDAGGIRQPNLFLEINENEEIPDGGDQVYARGCMRSEGSDVFMPLSLVAKPGSEDGAYEITIYSTVSTNERDPYVVRLEGTLSTNRSGLSDDDAGGNVTTEFSTGEWHAVHRESKVFECPGVGYEDYIQADVRMQKDLAYNPPREGLMFEIYTPIVSSALQVTAPDGSIEVIEEYTDIFSPNVDFMAMFRFLHFYEGDLPVVGKPYTFVLLDLLGDIIPGTESQDVFWRCNQDAPRNIRAVGTYGSDIELTWDAVPVIPGEFEPKFQNPDSGSHVPYQVNVYPAFENNNSRLGSLTNLNNHALPWDEFEPGSGGHPEGSDFGQPLGTFVPGLYVISLESWNMPIANQGGFNHDCEVTDSSENLFMEIMDGEVSFTASGSISGVVLSSEGPAINISVDACRFEQEEPLFCRSAFTNENGVYRITGLFPGEYRVQVTGNQGGWIDEFYLERSAHEDAEPVMVFPGEDTGDINFTMDMVE